MFDSVLHRADANKTRFGAGTLISIALHAGMLSLALWLSTHQATKATRETVVRFFAPPPPPPPPPPPRSHARVETKKIERKVKKPDTIFTPKEIPKEVPKPEEPEPDPEQEDEGVEGGVEGGVKGGVVGGVLGGVVGGTLGGTGTGPAKVVPSFIFDRERVAYPDPHLPEAFKTAHAKQNVQGMYRICVDTQGRVTSVTVMTPIGGGVDDAIIQQVTATWRWKPQPVPVCTPRVFLFKIN